MIIMQPGVVITWTVINYASQITPHQQMPFCLTNSVCSAAAHYLPALTKQINFIIFIIADCWTRASRASSLCVANNTKEDFSQVR